MLESMFKQGFREIFMKSYAMNHAVVVILSMHSHVYAPDYSPIIQTFIYICAAMTMLTLMKLLLQVLCSRAHL